MFSRGVHCCVIVHIQSENGTHARPLDGGSPHRGLVTQTARKGAGGSLRDEARRNLTAAQRHCRVPPCLGDTCRKGVARSSTWARWQVLEASREGDSPEGDMA